VINRLKWMQKNYPLTKSDLILQKTPYTFDVSVWELFWWSFQGAKVCLLIPGGEKDPAVIAEAIEKEKVNVMHFVPSLLNLFLKVVEKEEMAERLKSLKQVFASGEELKPQQVDRFNRLLYKESGTHLANLYGPTEATVDVSYFNCPALEKVEKIPIGKPIDNIQLLVVDCRFHLQPIGVVGELCIAGVGLARGYLNRPGLTGEKFLSVSYRSYRTYISKKIYKTGDLARWLPDGNIEFLGRSDFQVKIRGLRIELEEIEHQLLKNDNITQVVVAVKEREKGDEDKYLYACYVSSKELPLDVSALRNDLAKELPNYMIPSHFVRLDKIPLTPNGKIDRNALPGLETCIDTGSSYETPRNETEKMLTEVWEEVLTVSKPGINDNFFQLGGHSLKAMAVVSNIHKQLNVKLAITEVFKRPTIKKFSAYINNEEKNIYSSIEPVEQKDFYPLSSAQQRLFVLNRLEEKSTNYNIPTVMTIDGNLEIDKCENILKKLIIRHQSLRTSFQIMDGEPRQIIHPGVEFHIDYHEAGKPVDESAQKIVTRFIRPFDMSCAPLMRCGIIKLSDTRHVWIIDIHHIISDGGSQEVLVEEFSRLYMGEPLPGLRIDYKDYAVWQQTMFRSEELKQQEQYWLDRFAGEIPVLNFPSDYPRPVIQSFEGDYLRSTVSKYLITQLKKLAIANGATLYMLLLAAYNVLLYKYTGQEDIIVGSPVYGRPHTDLQPIVGMFVNTLVMRNFPAGEKFFREFLWEVKQNALQTYENQDYPFEELVVKLDVERDMSRNPLFDAAFTLQNYTGKEILLEDLNISRYEFEDYTVKFDLLLMAFEMEEELLFHMEYCTGLFKRRTMEQFIMHFITMLEAIAANPKAALRKIEILSEAEKSRFLYDFNSPEAVYPQSKRIHDIFAEQVEKNPHRTAVTLAENTVMMTYKQFNQKANQLAVVLRKSGVTSDRIVGIIIEPSFEMIIAIIGILKAGGAYLPINPEYPADRIKFMLYDSHTDLVLSNNQLRDKITFNEKIIDLDDPTIHEKAPENLSNVNIPKDLAYLIYTSGTTGKPKGVMIEHRNVIRLMFNDQFQFDFSSSDTWTMFHSYNFDFSVWEMYGALLYGGKLILIPRMTVIDPVRYLKVLREEKVTILNQVPSAFYNLIDEELKRFHQEANEERLHLRYVIFGGEALKPAMLKEWKEKYPGTRLINMFGITETTVHVTYKEIEPREILLDISNIGHPIPTTTTYGVDKQLKLVPVGVPGELCVGGQGVCRGYLNKPELTAEKFIRNPYIPAERIYKSGDWVRLTDTGEMEYLGRIDHQVQIRGFRIELGEIESKLLQKNEINEVIVVDRENQDGDHYLCAYIVTGKDLDVSQLREYLNTELPDYMIPNYFVCLERIPLTSNGKVDRKQLPEPEAPAVEEYNATENETQVQLVEVWQQALNLKQVDIMDNFFRVGGDSIKAIRLISLINSQFNTNLRIVDVYTHQTLRELAGKLNKEKPGDNGRRDKENAIKGVLPELEEFKKIVKMNNRIAIEEIENIYPMSNIEKGMVFHYLKDPGEAIYHDQPLFQQKYENFDIKRMKRALALMIHKNPILRTGFIFEEFAHVIYKYKESFGDIVYRDISAMKKEEQEVYIKKYTLESRNRPFDVSKPPLWRFGFFKTSNRNIVILWEFHHAILDGWSSASFLTELNNTYHRLKVEPDFVPKKLKSGYKEFIINQISEKKNQATIEYWENELSGYKRLHFPKTTVKKELKAIIINFGFSFRKKVESVAKKYNTTLKHLCFAAYIYMLNMLAYESDITVGLVTNIRPVCEDGDKILGCFLNTVPFRMKISPNIKGVDFIQLVDSKMRQLKKYDKLPLLEIVKIIGEKTEDRNPIFDSSFNFIDFYAYSHMEYEKGQINLDNRLQLDSYEKTSYPFDFNINTLEDLFTYKCNYNTGLISDEDAHRLYRYFKEILNTFIDDAEGILQKSKMISREEREKLLYDFNATESEFPGAKTIHELFAEQAERTPDHVALIAPFGQILNAFGRMHLSYRELNERVNRLAGLLIEKGVKADTIVGLMMERSLELMLGIFAILKAGGVYLPIDPNYPQERIDYMLADSSAEIFLTTPNLSNEFTYKNGIVYVTDAINRVPTPSHLHLSPWVNAPATSLAYVIYTSGTTGQPKGTGIEHASLVNRLHWMQKKYPLDQADVLLQKTPFTFDVSVWELFWWGLAGARLCLLVPGGEKDPEVVVDTIETQGVTVIHFVPSMFNAFLQYVEGLRAIKKLSGLKQIICSGEALSSSLVKRSNELLYKQNRTKLANLYGPTEATIDVSYFDCTAGKTLETIPIGKPIDNIRLLILSQDLQPQPIGVSGELHISGIGLSRGYLNRPELTAEKFLPVSPGIYGSYMSHMSYIYRTGDLARWLWDGNIEFLGRIDHQVKIRGFRIELSEIENQLSSYTNIKEVVVLPKNRAPVQEGHENTDMHLWAYYVPASPLPGEGDVDAFELKRYLAAKLPGFMIPSSFIPVEKIPLTPNGKVDKKTLQEAVQGQQQLKSAVVLPGNDLQKSIAHLWKQILNLDTVSIYDNFFDLGGTSLDNIILNSQLRERLNRDIPIVEMYRNPTIGSFARYLDLEGPEETLADIEKNISIKQDRLQQRRLKQRARKMKGTRFPEHNLQAGKS